MNKTFHSSLFVTGSCDRGCSHCCMADVIVKPKHMNLGTVNKIADEIAKSPYEKVSLSLLGGEPLRWPHLIPALDLFFENLQDRLDYVTIVTSGVSPNKKNEKKVFGDLLEKPYLKSICLDISFNLYNKDFPKRLIKTLSWLINSEKVVRSLLIKMCLHCEAFNETYVAFNDVIDEVEELTDSEIYPFLVDQNPENSAKIKKDSAQFFQYEHFSRDNLGLCSTLSFYYDCIYAIEKGENVFGMSVHPFSLVKQGKAKEMDASPLHKQLVCTTLFKDRRGSDHLTVTTSGDVYPECCFMHYMRLGKIGSKPLEAMAFENDLILSKAFWEFLKLKKNPKVDDSSESFCYLCERVKLMA